MRRPFISVIIPNYNHKAFLQERLDSIFSQTFQDYEIILLDDSSTDGSERILQMYSKHSKVSHIIINTKNSGSPFTQWRHGLELAKGEWIWIAESDDTSDNMFLENLIKKVKSNANTNLAYCGSYIIDQDGTTLEKDTWARDISHRNWDLDYVANGVDEIKSQLYFKNTVPNASAAIFRKDAVDLKVFNEIATMKFAGDWFFWVKLLEKGDVMYDSRFMNNFRKHSESTRSVKNRHLEIKRFKEISKVLYYIRNKYNLSWSVAQHDWIIADWTIKYRHITASRLNFMNPNFPLIYNAKLLINVLKKIIRRR